MMVVAVVVVVEERAKWWRSIMVEATQPGRPADRDDPSGGEGPCSKQEASGVIGEKERDGRGGEGETERGEIEVGQ